MRLVSFARIAPLALGVLAAGSEIARGGIELPAGFVVDTIGSGWNQPVGVCFIDGARLLVAEKSGRIWYVENEVKKNLALDVPLEVLNALDRGMLSIAIDPSYDQNGFVYLMFAVDPNQDGSDGEKEAFCRLVRYTFVYDAQSNLVADPASRVDLLGDTWTTGIPSCHFSHSIGTIRFLSDGSLVLTCGDGAHYDAVDQGGLDPLCFGSGRFTSDQDVGSFRSVYPNTLAGKVLRLDRATGLGLPDNPWFDGDPASFASRTWARGLRNPFRFTLLPNSGPRETLLIGDVGWNDWEEINVARGGENFAWPCMEGSSPQLSYVQNDPQGFCPGVQQVATAPLFAYHHFLDGPYGIVGNCVSGLAWYGGASYPPIYRDKLFVCDYGRSWMAVFQLDANQNLVDVLPFGEQLGGPIDLQIDPGTGDLVYISFQKSEIRRIHYFGNDSPPVVVASTSATWGPAPLSVTFDGTDSYDPEGAPLQFLWDFGDGATSTLARVPHVYASAINATATLTLRDPQGFESSQSFLISPGNTPPAFETVSSPGDGFVFHPGVPFEVSAAAGDREDAELGLPVAVQWIADLVHGDHVHPGFATVDGPTGTMTLESHGPGTFYRLTASATDSRGLSEAVTLSLYDAEAVPEASLDGLSDPTLRLGQSAQGTGHAEYPNTAIGWPKPDLIWDWGDGTTEVFQGVDHQQLVTPTHVYPALGDYVVRLTVRLGDHVHSVTAPVQVVAPAPAVAVFTPLLGSGYVPWDEQQPIAQAIAAALTAQGTEVASFAFNQQDQLAAWMTPYLDDGVCDVLVVLDYSPAAIYAGQAEFSLAEEWLENGNAIVWSGEEPFSSYIQESGAISTSGAGANGPDEVLDAPTGSFVCRGSGVQEVLPLGQRQLPSLQPYLAFWGLRYTLLPTSAWKVVKLYARDENDPESDAILMRHASGGFYAQLLCAPAVGAMRSDVLVEFLRTYSYWWANPTAPKLSPGG